MTGRKNRERYKLEGTRRGPGNHFADEQEDPMPVELIPALPSYPCARFLPALHSFLWLFGI